MEIIIKNIKISNSRNLWIKLIPLGDIHLGNTGCDLKKLKEQINYIKEKKDCYWVGMGDYVDSINYSDKRFDPTTVAEPFISHLSNCIPLQIETLAKLLAPIKDKCLGLLRGNHEEKIRLQHHYDIIYEMRKVLGLDIPDLKDAAIMRLRFNALRGGSYIFDIFVTHGNVGGRKGGAKVNRLEDMIGYMDADIYLMGHSHIKVTESRSVLYVDNNLNLKYRKRVLACTGCFLNGYTKGIPSYVEKWNYPPTSTGCIKLMINPRRHDIHVSE